jgi:hypothetical protein
MQQAPAYRADLDLYIEAPNGDCDSFCTIWLDAKNKYKKLLMSIIRGISIFEVLMGVPKWNNVYGSTR